MALLADGRLTAARDEVNRAIDHESTNWRWFLIRAQIDSRLGNPPAVNNDLFFAKALARAPRTWPRLALPPERPGRSVQRAIPARRLISADRPLVFSGRPGPGAMEQSPETRSLRDYLRAIKARRWLVIGTTVAAVAASILISVARTPVYKATATISVPSDFNVTPGAPSVQTSAKGAAGKEAAKGDRSDVLAAASRALGGDRTPQQLQTDLTATAEKGINSVSVEAKASTADGAARIANAVAAAMVRVSFDQRFRLLQGTVLRNLSPARSGPYGVGLARTHANHGAGRSPRAERPRPGRCGTRDSLPCSVCCWASASC